MTSSWIKITSSIIILELKVNEYAFKKCNSASFVLAFLLNWGELLKEKFAPLGANLEIISPLGANSRGANSSL